MRRWYCTLAGFPSVAAVACWLAICFPNAGIAFEVVYEVFEAVCLTRFLFIVLVLANGGVDVLDRYFDSLLNGKEKTFSRCGYFGVLAVFYPMLGSREFDAAVAADRDQDHPPSAVGSYLIFVYQFVVIGPICVFFEAVCTYSDTDRARSAAALFNLIRIVSTMMAAVTLLSTVCRFFDVLPAKAFVHKKFASMKGMILLGTLQASDQIVVSCPDLS